MDGFYKARSVLAIELAHVRDHVNLEVFKLRDFVPRLGGDEPLGLAVAARARLAQGPGFGVLLNLPAPRAFDLVAGHGPSEGTGV